MQADRKGGGGGALCVMLGFKIRLESNPGLACRGLHKPNIQSAVWPSV